MRIGKFLQQYFEILCMCISNQYDICNNRIKIEIKISNKI